MRRIKRWGVVVRPKLPFYDWANSLGADRPELTPREFVGDATILLIPDQESHDSAESQVVSRHERIFEHFLGLRDEDPKLWPEQRSLDMFYDWFDVEIHENAIDLGQGRIKFVEL